MSVYFQGRVTEMKGKRRVRTRLGSLALAACMLISLLPVSAIIALAAGNAPAQVKWIPQEQVMDEERSVELTAELRQSEEAPVAAMIEIKLEADEVAALNWDGESISADTLGQDPLEEEKQTDEEHPTEGDQDLSDNEDPAKDPQTEEDVEEPISEEVGNGAEDADQDENGQTGSEQNSAVESGTEPTEENDEDQELDSEEDQELADGVQEDAEPNVGDQGAAQQRGTSASADGDVAAVESNTITQTLTHSDEGTGPKAILITNVEENGARLRILLDESGYSNKLSFRGADVDVEVKEDDVLVHYYDDGESLPNTRTAELLTGGEEIIDVESHNFRVFADILDEIEISVDPEEINLSGDGGETKADVTYNVNLQKPFILSGDKNYSFTVDLPDGLSLPDNELSVNQEGKLVTILCGETTVATLSLPQDETFSLPDDFSVEVVDNGFSFTVSAPGKMFAEGEAYDFYLTLYAGDLARSAEAISGEITLTVREVSDDEPTTVSASATVTAGESFPGQGGWDLVVTQKGNVTQQIYWADNNNEAGSRPTWSTTLGVTEDDEGYEYITPKLYYTLIKEGEEGATFIPVELTEETMENVALEAMPSVSYNPSTGKLSISDLPTRLEEQDIHGNVNAQYTVSWSLEPPDENQIPDAYTLRNIEEDDPEIEMGTVSAPGWYFVQLEDFVITLDVLQGIEDPLQVPEMRDLLRNNFSFHWEYDGQSENDPGTNTLAAMLGDGSDLSASYDADTGKLTISGLWRYSLNGNRVTYYLQETEDDGEEDQKTADGVLSEDELPESITGEGGPLDADDWYSILYNNTGVSNEGQNTTAVYNGGTLRLIRGGETTYTATKVWRDAFAQDYEDEERPDAIFTLYRYSKADGVGTASIYSDGVIVRLVWVDGAENEETGETTDDRWEIRVIAEGDKDAEDPAPVQLPQYDSQSGKEWVYVVTETLEGQNADQYEQIFGTAEWNDEKNDWDIKQDELDDWGLASERAPGNNYLYNEDTLTNLQSDTISVGATKEWKAATFQSTLDDVAVELTLQVRVKEEGETWRDYTGTDGEPVTRYLLDFSAVKMTDSPTDLPGLQKYQGGDTTRELEYRWLETAVYTGVTEETDLSEEKRINVFYEEAEDGVSSRTSDDPVGTFSFESGSWTVEYTDGGRITNSVEDTVSYEAVKEWHGTSLKDAEEKGNGEVTVTLQIFRAVTGESFTYDNPYLEFQLSGTKVDEIKFGSSATEEEKEAIEVTHKNVLAGYDQEDDVTSWFAEVTGLPKYDDEGRTYEYILLETTEDGGTPVYHNVATNSADYRTIVVNGPGKGGFNLLIRKTWLDNSDTPHREPVTLTLYNKETGLPVKNAEGKNYTIELGKEEIWSSVYWIGPNSLAEGAKSLTADEVYLVETEMGDAEVDHHYNENDEDETTSEKLPYDYLYRQRDPGEDIFDVTTENHRYQVTYSATYQNAEEDAEEEAVSLPGGVGAAFTITNRRLGNIDLTVTKSWIDGRAVRNGEESVNDRTLSDEIGEVLENIYKKNNKSLALVFRLVFDDSMGTAEELRDKGWEITYTGPLTNGDTVCVGGETATIYSGYDEAGTDYDGSASSEQVIIGLDENGKATTSDEAYFYGLPKYDSSGNAVSYSVEEIWLDVTGAGAEKEPQPVNLSEYPELEAIWSDYAEPKFELEYENNVEGSKHTLDRQTLHVTNQRDTTKEVQWTKVWKDNYTNENNLRPDLYLEIYRVVHERTEEPVVPDEGETSAGEGKEPQETAPTYVRKIEYVGSSGDWEKKSDNEWTLTLNLDAFDDFGFEIYYYAVERTTQPADRYDYQAGEYSLDGAELGTRDKASTDEGISILSEATVQESGDYAYDLLVLGTRAGDASDDVDSIQWADPAQKPDNIGTFGNGTNYAKYALVEGGTFTNTLAQTYSIDGMKYWTSLPGSWPDDKLPSVRFLVYRYAQSDKISNLDSVIVDGNGDYRTDEDCDYFAAELTIPSNQWEALKSGNGYRYLIRYNGENTLSIDEETGELVCGVPEGGVEQPLERYDENGELYTYVIREVVEWDEGVNVSEDEVFTISPSANGFYFTNDYTPATGSIQVKKFLYLPMGENDQPEAYPAVTFKLTRQVTYNGETYEPDTSFRTRTVTIDSQEVLAAWENLATDQNAGYVTLEKTFENLPLYAPNGREYRYTVIEDRDELKGYETWAESGDIESPDEVDGVGVSWTQEDSKNYTDAGIDDGIKIEDLTPAPDENEEEATAAETLDAGTAEETAHAATFKNKQPDEPQEYENGFTAEKVWDDSSDAYKFRPTADQFEEILGHVEHVEQDDAGKVTWSALKREAGEQTGQGNEITEYLVPNEDFTLKVTKAGDDTYQIIIQPVGENAFELYAPNGMPWVYSFSEPVTENHRLQINFTDDDADANKIYAPPADTNGAWPEEIQPETGDTQNTNFGSLTNTTHMSYKFNKEWVDEQGSKITENYLGKNFALTVSFQLQVSDDGRVNWHDAGDYFSKQGINTSNMKVTGAGVVQGTDTDAWDTATITAAVDAVAWGSGGTFTKLPTVLKNDSHYTLLQYRVIETAVTYGSITQEITNLKLDDAAIEDTTTGSYTVDKNAGGLVTKATFTRRNSAGISTSTNQLATTSVSVTKVWNDTDNQYSTRPGAEGPWTWGSWFVLQRTTGTGDPEDEDAVWENVAVFEKLYGGQESSDSAAEDGNWTAEITGLPTTDYSGTTAQPYTYRVRELQPKDGGYTSVDSIEEGDIVEDNGIYNQDGSQYIASHKEGAQKDWTVTNSLDLYIPDGDVSKITAKKQWAVPDTDKTPKPSVTFQLQYTTDEVEWKPTTFGSANKIANEENDWTVDWENLPDTIGGQKVTYRVVELDGDGWVEINEPVALLSGEEAAYTFINTLSWSYTVEKTWIRASTATDGVTIRLYRTTDPDEVGSTSGSWVPVSEMDPDEGFRQVTLSSSNNWRHIFTDLPKYNANNQLYYYYALELDASGNPVQQNGKITQNGTDYEVSYDWDKDGIKTSVTNTTATSLAGTKTWKDNGDYYNTRPDSLKLILERKVGTGDWTNVSALYTPTWDKTTNADQNQWTYTYTGLPQYDENGNPYTYQVREEVPDGYELTGKNGNNFTNVLSEKINIIGQKIWSGDVGETPTLTLERKTENETEWVNITETIGQPTWSENEDGSSQWTFIYADLDKYDSNGILYEYRVREEHQDGYTVFYKTETVGDSRPATSVDGMIITNYQDGNLTVSKTVSGNQGDPNKEFHFTVTLTGNSSVGTTANTIGGDFETRKTNTDNTTSSGTIAFTGGVSATFTLKHNESLTIQGLPAGIGYQVTEVERDQGGYTTSGTDWDGTIPAGSTVEAEFNNYSHDSGGGGEEEDERIDLTGTKTWVDDGQKDPARPDYIQLVLERSVDGRNWEQYHAMLTWSGKDTNTWTYTFHNLPKTDSDGKTYRYRVSEIVPPGYVSEPIGNNIINRKQETNPGSLQVTKQVTGSRGDPTREFTFTVTLSNRNLKGIYGQMTFIDGVATFTLHSGETILAENLPDGTTYTVTEAEANQDGYTTTAVGDTGTITADTVASAIFTNDRPRHDRPDDPDEPDPEYPDEPDEPDYPGDPDQPDEPNRPDDPDTPHNPDIPRTDDPTRNGLLAALCLISLGGMAALGLLELRKRKKYRGKRLK